MFKEILEIKTTRPRFDSKMLDELSKRVADIIKNHHDYNDIDDCIEDAKSVLHYNYDNDGYELAKEFEQRGYNGSESLVDDLGEVRYYARDILDASVKEWVKSNGILLDLGVGSKIIFDAWKKNNENGEIVELYPNTAQYGVWCDSIGKPKGSSHYVINMEKIKMVVDAK